MAFYSLLKEAGNRKKHSFCNIFHLNTALRLLFWVHNVFYLYDLQMSIIRHFSVVSTKYELYIRRRLNFNDSLRLEIFEIFQIWIKYSRLGLIPPTLPYTAKNALISLNFLVWTFCGKAQFPQSFGRFARNSGETVHFRKICTPEIRWKLRVFFAVLFETFASHWCFIWISKQLTNKKGETLFEGLKLMCM